MTKQERMKFHEMQAYWWTNAASNGYAKTRQLFHGTTGPEFTDDEKVVAAMETAKRHITMFNEVAEDWDINTANIDKTGKT